MPCASSALKISDPSLIKLYDALLALKKQVKRGFIYNELFAACTPPIRSLAAQHHSTMPENETPDLITTGEVLIQRLDSLITYLLSLMFINTDGDFKDKIESYVKQLNDWSYTYLAYYSTFSSPAATHGMAPQRTIPITCTISHDSLLRFILCTDSLRSYLDSRRISDPLLQSATDYNQLQIQFKNYSRKNQDLEGKLVNFKDKHSSLQEDIQKLSNALTFAQDIEQIKITAPSDADKVKAAEETVNHLNTILEDTKQIIKAYKSANQRLDDDIAALKTRTETLYTENQKRHALINDLLRGATTVSLAKAFKDKSDTLTARQILWFFLLAGSLVLVVFWNVLHLTPQLAEDLFGFSLTPVLTDEITSRSPWLIFLYTEITCFPFFWMVWLATSLIRNTFKLMEDYDYKATSARTYVGYSYEADKLEKDDDNKPLKQKVFNSVINRLEEHPLRVMDREASGSPLLELIALLSSSKFQKALSKTGEEGENFLKELISVLTHALHNTFPISRKQINMLQINSTLNRRKPVIFVKRSRTEDLVL